MATHSSGLMPLKPSLPVSFFTSSCTAGIRLEPPTIRTLEMSLPVQAGVGHGLTHGAGMVASTRWAVSSLNLARVRVTIQVLGAGGVGGDIGQVDVGGGDAGQLDLGLLGGLLQALHGHLVAGQVHAVGLLELADHPVHDALVEVVAAQTVVAGGGQHLDDAVVDVQDGHIEGAAAQVVHHDLLGALLIHAVGQSRGGRLVDDPLHVQAGDLAGVLGGLTLGVGEVSGDGDDRLGDGASPDRPLRPPSASAGSWR